MMLTGRVYSATEGASYGFAQYLTEEGNALAKAMELAAKVATNAPLTNFAVLQALPMIAEANPQTGLLMESLMATVAQSDKEAKLRIRAFLDRKTAKVKPTDMSAKPHILSARGAPARAQRIRCVRSRSAIPLSRSIAGPMAPSISGRNGARRLSGSPDRPAASLGQGEPARIFMAERDGGGGWRQITYAELLTSSRHIASAPAGARSFG